MLSSLRIFSPWGDEWMNEWMPETSNTSQYLVLSTNRTYLLLALLHDA